MNYPESIAAIIQLNDGELVGKTRLQKTVYLLEEMGLKFGFPPFDYHHYGPFLPEVAYSTDDAIAFGFIDSREEKGAYDIPYTIYTSKNTLQQLEKDDEKQENIRAALEAMKPYSSMIMELAASADYLKKSGYPNDYWEEVKKRKPLKATPERVEQAKALLRELGLENPA